LQFQATRPKADWRRHHDELPLQQASLVPANEWIMGFSVGTDALYYTVGGPNGYVASSPK
jgi:hypothetical protein